jgi:hypothetical protein
MPSLLDKFKKEMTAAGIKPRTQNARSWLQSKIYKMKIPSNRSNLLNDPGRISARAFIGKMYFFHYDAKYKDTLPVWDKFPLVIPMDITSDGFMGLNLHYLDPYSRLLLLDRLQDFISNDKYDDTTRFKLSYDLLSQSKRYNTLISNCVKRYLLSHIMSPLIYIEPDNWETAIFLPTEKMVYKT